MLRPITVAALAAITLLMTSPRVGAGLMTQQVTANTTDDPAVEATAFHGFIDAENEADGFGNPLLRFLNSGTNDTDNLQLFPNGAYFTISSTGMFSTPAYGPGVIDVVEAADPTFAGFKPANGWEFVGKSEFDSDLNFEGGEGTPPFDSAASGVLTLTNGTPLAKGSYVLSLKGGGGKDGPRYGVFLFANVEEISSFNYNVPFGLSHASLYRVRPGGNVPEPASLAVFGIGALLGIGGSVRRRFTNRKGFALRGLAT